MRPLLQRLLARLRRVDTLFLRLFLLMWVTLVLSHLVAFSVFSPAGTSWVGRLSTQGATALPPLPSLPPGNPLSASESRPPMAPQAPPEAGGPPPQSARSGPPQPPAPSNGFGPGAMPPMSVPAPWRGLPATDLWLDYALRALLIGVGAALGARWLSGPMRRLAQASSSLSQGLHEGRSPTALDEAHGTVEVRATARAFNAMAAALKQQFDQRSLHMAAVSHDLRTPLTRLRLRLEQWPGEAARAAGEDIRVMDEMINLSLAVVREQSTGAPPALLDLGALLQSLADDRQEQRQPVRFVEPDGDDAAHALRVRAHPASLRRIVDNLVDNALRYGRVARIACHRAQGQAVVTVDDDGPGISPDQLQHVLQPWVRLPTQGSTTGSGLGLAIAHDLAQREGGHLRLENRSGGGLRAILTLPLAA